MKLDNVIFYSHNLINSKNFYLNILNLKLSSESDNFISLSLDNNVSLGIKLFSSDRDKTPGQQSLSFSTDNINEIYNTLKSQSNITFIKDLTQNSWGDEFAISDPDGNKIIILNMKK